MTRQITSTRRQPACGSVPTTDPADAVIRLRRAEYRLEVLAAALRALVDTDAGTPAQRRQRAMNCTAVLDRADL
jgi:hypothetical protein